MTYSTPKAKSFSFSFAFLHNTNIKMCLQCRLRGALVNCDENGTPIDFDISKYYGCECYFDEGLTEDKSAMVHLRGTLEVFRDNGLSLVAVDVSSDGSCLPHAISTCLIGNELLFDGLRACLLKELVVNEDWYRKNTDVGRTTESDVSWYREWMRICSEAAPTRGDVVGPDKYLGDIHILAFANLLGRPILLLDSIEKMMIAGTEGHGLFPPLRRSRDEILNMHDGRIPSVLTVATANSSANHYVSIMSNTLFIDRNRPAGDEGDEGTSTAGGGRREHAMGEAFSFFNAFREYCSEQKLMDDELSDLMHCFILMTYQNSPTMIGLSARTLRKILLDINCLADNSPNNNDKCLELKFSDNQKNLKHTILHVAGAIEILQGCGYIQDNSNGKIVLQYGSKNRGTIRDYYYVKQRRVAISCLDMLIGHNSNRNNKTSNDSNNSSSSSSNNNSNDNILTNHPISNFVSAMDNLITGNNCKNNNIIGFYRGLNDVDSEASASLLGMPSIFNEYNEDRSPRKSSESWFADIVREYGTGSCKPQGGVSWTIGGYTQHSSKKASIADGLKLTLNERFKSVILDNFFVRENRPIFKDFDHFYEFMTSAVKNSNQFVLAPGLIVKCENCQHAYNWNDELTEDVDIQAYFALQVLLKEKRLCPHCSLVVHSVYNTFLFSVFVIMKNIFVDPSAVGGSGDSSPRSPFESESSGINLFAFRIFYAFSSQSLSDSDSILHSERNHYIAARERQALGESNDTYAVGGSIGDGSGDASQNVTFLDDNEDNNSGNSNKRARTEPENFYSVLSNWEVLDSTSCYVCNKQENEDQVLLCDGILQDGASCDKEYHTYCLEPQLKTIPVEAWFCPTCTMGGNTTEQNKKINELKEKVICEFGLDQGMSLQEVIHVTSSALSLVLNIRSTIREKLELILLQLGT
jgi:hypothetical protein